MRLFAFRGASFRWAVALVLLVVGTTGARAQIPVQPDFKGGGKTSLQGTLTVTQHTIIDNRDSGEHTTEDWTIRCPVEIFQGQGAPPLDQIRRGVTKEMMLPYLGDAYPLRTVEVGAVAGGALGTGAHAASRTGAAVGAAEGVQGLATATFQRYSIYNDHASDQLFLTSAKSIRAVGALQVETPGANGLKPGLLLFAEGNLISVHRDKDGKETRGNGPGLAFVLDPHLKIYVSKKDLNAGYASGKTFRVQATDTQDVTEGGQHTRIEGKIVLQVGVIHDEYEMEIFPFEEYETWTPQGGKDEQTEGNRMRFRVLLRTADGTRPLYSPKKVTVTLTDTSKEPGVCLNYPLKDSHAYGKTTPDYRLAADESQNPPITTAEDGQTLTFGEDACQNQTAFSYSVVSFDWGGWTKMKVEAFMPDGKTVTGYLTKKKTVTSIPLPYRENPERSHIAAAFWKQNDFPVKADDWDGVKQDGNTHDGDGFTAYERYRGVWAQGKHEQITPHSKVLIVENRIGEKGTAAFGVFSVASGIHVIEMKEGELTDDRIVNANASTAHKGDQYGLIVTFGEVTGDGVVARAAHVTRRLDIVPDSPKFCSKVLIRKDTFDGVKWSDAEAAANTLGAIAHEMAHGCHVSHHGPTLEVPGISRRTPREIKDARTGTFFGADDHEVTTRPLVLKDEVALPHGEPSGDADCIMCYNHVYTWVMPQGAATPIFVNMGDRSRPGTKFCTSSKGTLWNAPDHKVFSAAGAAITMPLFGDASVGNCMSQFQIKDY